MNDLQQDIGSLKARMDEHDKRFDRLDDAMHEGFTGMYTRLEALTAAENQRKGQMVAWGKIIAGATGVAGIWEAVKALWPHH